MNDGFDSTGFGDPRLLAHALSVTPAWAFTADGTRILWANPPGADVFKAPMPETLAALRFEPDNPNAAQVARLTENLPAGVWRLERLRGFGAAVGGMLTCQCMRVELAGEAAVLIVSGERAGPGLSFEARMRRLVNGSANPAAVFSTKGKLLDASADAIALLGARNQLDNIGAAVLAQQAGETGHAEGETAIGHVALDRLNAGDSSVLLMTLRPSVATQMKAESEITTPPAVETTEAPATPADNPAPAAPTGNAAPAAPERPLRFVWHIDSEQRFTIQSEEAVRLLGPRVGGLLGKPWGDIAGELDPQGLVAPLLARHDTWTGVVLHWPADDGAAAVELSGLPLFGGNREIEGYRGFGICRDIMRLRELAALRDKPAQPVSTPEPEPEPESEHTATVVPFPAAERPPALDAKEASNFDELARTLSDRLKKPVVDDDFGDERPELISTDSVPPPPGTLPEQPPAAVATGSESELLILDRLPVGILIYRLNDLVYANRAFLDWTGYPSLMALREAGGLDSLFIETAPGPAIKNGNGGKTLTISTPTGKQRPVQGRLFSTQWSGDSALVLMLNTTAPPAAADDDLKTQQIQTENRELKAVLNTATDGILLIDRAQRILFANHGAESLFGMEQAEFDEITFADLFAPESRRAALEYLDRVSRGGSAALMNAGLEVSARVRRGGLIPLHVSMGEIEGGEKLCAVFRDISAWKRTEGDLIDARRTAESASAAKSDFLAKISHEIRTPLNAIIGFSEVMLEERFGAVGNERYRDYLRDIHTSGGHLISLLNELLDLSKIEAGKLELTFAGINLNDLTQQCVAIMQQQANREKVIIRSSLAQNLPQVVADARSVRQIVLNLLSNAIKFTGAGAQVIVSTAVTDSQEVMLRVRDTGEGMSDQELKAALEPFRQLATASRWGASGTGLGLPITKALAEANHASFRISSALHDGTMIEIAFPAARVLA